MQLGEYFPLVSPYENDFAALMFVKGRVAVVFVWRVRGSEPIEAKFTLDGFDGRALAIPLKGAYDSTVLELR